MSFSRREFLATGTAALAMPGPRPAHLAITLDLEMSRNFPSWDATHWDYEKGNLDVPTKRYAVEAAKRVKAAGGVIHFFAVGRTLEQPDVDWLKEIASHGHPIGNHTYDHVNVLARRPEEIQFRFTRSPWLIDGKPPAEVIRENVRLAAAAIKTRIGCDVAGFRTPGGFANGLADRPDVRTMLRDHGHAWVSSKYPAHESGEPGREPGAKVLDSIVAAQRHAQPFKYPCGLVEVPMSPISDIGAFRTGRWKLAWFLKAVRLAVEWAIDTRSAFDFLGHPSCLHVVDPEFQAIELICELAQKSRGRGMLADLTTLAARAQ